MRTTRLFEREICAGDRPSLSAILLKAMAMDRKSVFFCNVHMLMLSQEDANLAAAMAAADLVFADGVPVAWLQKHIGTPDATVLRGYEAVDLICSEIAGSDKKIGFLGSSTDVLHALSNNLQQKYPGLNVGFTHSPGMLSENSHVDHHLVTQINDRELYCLFIGLGCPKQEKWVRNYAPHLNCNLLAVGAAFDWLAGTTKKPPDWMEKFALAWLFRLIQNPRRMWARYLKYNTRFILSSLKLLSWDRWVRNG